MEVIVLLALLAMITFAAMTIESILNDRDTKNQIDRDKMKNSILEIEKILALTDTHHEIELDRMSDRELSRLYHDLGEKFDYYIRERNAASNKKALEDF